ncbi:related to Pre-mRNA polyadenylation factor FIP1 [Cephalotrichum gorgonifer]|uniref:Related to Pre-mRNA polyadenylation factor FIP1 n=1 Tax=Cephalotrichum gorgonifer TaxID=2041049 RepID=A0AAE8MY99_9PEZI|nr:related to Pre-mRNA polyadenylation factor FIP1 [Cephalotrichum gorgonifer]
MEIEDEDDFYAPEEPIIEPVKSEPDTKPSAGPTNASRKDEELEEGEEEDEGGEIMDEDDDDSDVDFIMEPKEGEKAPAPQQSRYSDIKNIPQRTTSGEVSSKPATVKEEQKPLPVPTADQAAAAASSSKIDINANPVYPAAGKPITQVNIDTDLPENSKPWRNPGTDLSDYFNYGFDEFTWALYASKQESVRVEFNPDLIAASNKKMMEEFNNMMMGGMGGMGGPAGGAGGGMGPGGQGGMAGMDGMTPEMQQMMQQMMASGVDPSQMDPSQMAAMFSGMQGAPAGSGGGQGGQGGGYQQGFGGGQGQGQAYGGFDQGMGGGGGRGGFNRRGGQRRW